DSVRAVIGTDAAISDVTPVLMSSVDGLRAIVDEHEIAQLEWGSARSSAAVWNIVLGTKPGMTELECASKMGYAGEPLTCHVMMSAASAPDHLIGLSSPSAR